MNESILIFFLLLGMFTISIVILHINDIDLSIEPLDNNLQDFCTKNGYAGAQKYTFYTGRCFSFTTKDIRFASKLNGEWRFETQ
jgi:hypothetical protein